MIIIVGASRSRPLKIQNPTSPWPPPKGDKRTMSPFGGGRGRSKNYIIWQPYCLIGLYTDRYLVAG